MLELTSKGEPFKINGLWVYPIEGIEGLNPRTLLLQMVKLNGETTHILHVETYALPDVTGRPFGVVVGERIADRGSS